MSGKKSVWWKRLVTVLLLTGFLVNSVIIAMPVPVSADVTDASTVFTWSNGSTIHVENFPKLELYAQRGSGRPAFDFHCLQSGSTSNNGQYLCNTTTADTGPCGPYMTINKNAAQATLFFRTYSLIKGVVSCPAAGSDTVNLGNTAVAPADLKDTGADPCAGNTTGNNTGTCGEDDTGNTDDGDTVVDPELQCGGGITRLSWWLCPLYHAVNKVVSSLDSLINSLLTVDQVAIFTTTRQPGKGYYAAWSTFRTLAIGLLIVAALIMVISSALGIQILDAYTIKKVVPRLLLAAVAITLSWYLMEFFVTLTNALGNGIRGIIYEPFKDFQGSIQLGGGAASIAALLGAGAIFALGPAGVLSFAATAGLAIAVAALVLIVRQLVVVILILIAPIAIACSILPNTQGAYKLWYESFTKALLMFPIIVAFIAVGRVFAMVSIGSDIGSAKAVSQLIGFAAYFLPYFLIPLTFSLAGGAMRTIGGRINDANRGGFDRLKKFRGNSMARLHQERMQGKTWVGSGKTGSIYRRGALAGTPNSGAFNPTARGRAKFKATQSKVLAQTADEMLKNDNGRSAGDDDGNALAQQDNMTAGKYVDQYSRKLIRGGMDQNAAKKAAQDSLAGLEQNYGARIGSTAMQVAAFKAKAGSSTGYAPGDYQTMEQDANRLISKGLITTTDAAATFKSNQKRADQNGVGFGEWMTALDQARLYETSGGTQGARMDNTDMKNKAINGAGPGQILGGHKNAIKALAPQMRANLDAAWAQSQRSGATAADTQEFQRQAASIAGLLDVMGQINPSGARVMSDAVYTPALAGAPPSTKNPGQAMNLSEYLDTIRDNPDFKTMRREYGSQAAANYNTLQGNAAGTASGAPPGQLPHVG